jgi:hypothetical protein
MSKLKISKPSQPKNAQLLVSISEEDQEKICGGGKKPHPTGKPWLDSDGYLPPSPTIPKSI